MTDLTVKYFSSGMTGAPQIAHRRRWNCWTPVAAPAAA